MSEHLPECHTSMIPDFDNERWICICDRLRACEQRVQEQNIVDLYNCTVRRFKEGYAAALNAAREAVATQQYIPIKDRKVFIITRNAKLWKQRDSWTEFGWWAFRDSALAAIDALRGEQ